MKSVISKQNTSRALKYSWHQSIRRSLPTTLSNLLVSMKGLTYGEIGASLICKPYPIAQISGRLRLYGRLSGLELNSTSIVDIYGHKLDQWNVGCTMIAGNMSAQLKREADKIVVSTRHRIHPRFVSLTEFTSPFLMSLPHRTTLAMGFEFDLNPRATLEVMVFHHQPTTFALQYQWDQCLVRFYSDVYSQKTGVSFSFRPSSFF
ncbi:uncharacterized protein LOC17887647 isoform X2 [Capsella rubella]|uniref:uncharacterized protein LOC17887647 isoform X2 n=1 Tax=Capsella rubella TaxID=81985 RepID=UPI000CD55F84|nr:uncharacterized protein LOC17887647 isoform X2 [Capsella rubella]